MSKKVKILLLILGIILLGVIVFLYLYAKSKPAPNPSSPAAPSEATGSVTPAPAGNGTNPGGVNNPGSSNNTPISPGGSNSGGAKLPVQYTPGTPFSVPTQDAPKMTLYTPDNAKIEVNNLYKNPANLVPGTDNTVNFIQNKDYYMFFSPKTEYFQITLLNPDIQKARSEAESDFLSTLGITKDQACQLNVELGVPYAVNQAASGKDYGLSFCPNGKPLPAS